MTEPPDAPYDPNSEPDPRLNEPPIPPGGWFPPPQGHTPADAAPHQGPPYQGPPSYQGPPPPYPGAPSYQGQPPPYPGALPPGWQPEPHSGWQPPSGGQPPPPEGWEHLGPPLPQPRRSRRAPLIAAIATAAVIAGGAASFVAFSNTNSGFRGAASPQEAVTSLVRDLNKSDLLGILDHLPPGERSALLDPLNEAISQAKRLRVLRATADPGRVSGVDVTATGIAFNKNGDETINDHVTVVKLVGGTVDINADLSRVPFTQQYLDAVFPGGVPASATSHETINLAQVDRDSGPVRIAAEKVGGKWYPSLFYTIADAAVHQSGRGNPGPADYIAPKGAASAVGAVKQAIVALQNGDYQRLIELTSPDELRVLHDYGGVILRSSSPSASTKLTIKNLQLTTRKVSGATRVSLTSVTVDAPGHETTVAVSGDCLEITADGDYRKFCAGDIANALNSGPLRNRPLTAEESAALSRFASGVPRIGIDVTSTDGQWYLNPVRSYLDLSNALLEPLQGNDLLVLLKLIRR